jgi:hypothetical protein
LNQTAEVIPLPSPEGGYVRIYRRVYEDPDFNNVLEASVFVYLIVKAAWRQTTVRYKDRIIELARGELALSQRDLANSFKVARSTVQGFLDRLAVNKKIVHRSVQGVTVISICNYDKYQAPQEAEQPPSRPPAVHPPSTGRPQNKEENKGKEGNLDSEELTLFGHAAIAEEEADLRSLVWSSGRAFLERRGVKPSQVGGLIGLWRKTLQDDGLLLELFGRAIAENVDEPVPWMQAAIRRELASPRKAPAQEFRGGLDPEERARRFGKFEVISSTDPIEVREAWRRRAYPIPEWVEEEERAKR